MSLWIAKDNTDGGMTMVWKMLLLAVIFMSHGRPILARQAEGRGRPLKIPIYEIPKTLDPHEGNFSNRNKITKQIFDSLATFDKSGLPIPSIARKWKINRKTKSVLFTIDMRVKFSDGSMLQPKDVVSSLIRSLQKKSQIADFILNADKCSQSNCASVKAVKSDQVNVILKDDNYELFLRAIAANEGAIIKLKGESFLGTGPYILAEKTPERIVIRRRPAAKTAIDEIQFIKVPIEEMTSKYLSGQIDELWSSHLTEAQLKERPSQAVHFRYYGTYAFFLNLKSGVFQHKNARKSFKLAVDRKKLLSALGERGEVATGFIPKGTPGHVLGDISPKLPEAKRLISALPKTTKREVHAIFHQSYKTTRAKFITVLQEIFEEIGLTLKVSYSGFTESLKAMKRGEYDLTAKTDSIQYYEPTTIFTPLLSNNFANINHYSNSELDRVVIEAANATDLDKKVKLLENAEKMISDDVPIVPVFYPAKASYYPTDLLIDFKLDGEIRYWEFPYRAFAWEK